MVRVQILQKILYLYLERKNIPRSPQPPSAAWARRGPRRWGSPAAARRRRCLRRGAGACTLRPTGRAAARSPCGSPSSSAAGSSPAWGPRPPLGAGAGGGLSTTCSRGKPGDGAKYRDAALSVKRCFMTHLKCRWESYLMSYPDTMLPQVRRTELGVYEDVEAPAAGVALGGGRGGTPPHAHGWPAPGGGLRPARCPGLQQAC